MKRLILLLPLLSAIFLGCAKDDPTSIPDLPLPPSMSGIWDGSSPGNLDLKLQLAEKRTAISGSGKITVYFNGLKGSGTVSGTDTYPRVSFIFSSPGYQPIVISGTFAGDETINVVLNQSGFTNFPLTFHKAYFY